MSWKESFGQQNQQVFCSQNFPLGIAVVEREFCEVAISFCVRRLHSISGCCRIHVPGRTHPFEKPNFLFFFLPFLFFPSLFCNACMIYLLLS